ncbi:MAG: ribose-5-phosphate isomerase RpiA [Pseudomonadota bacterium]
MSKELKIEAAGAALKLVENNMRLGIGTGSTADEFIRLLSKRVANGLSIIGVPTSERTRILCEELNVPLTTLDAMPELDMVIDGADEVDRKFNLIKGAGGALLREKIVAHAAKTMVVIADDSKYVETLGKFPLPIEVNPFGLEATKRAIQDFTEKLGLTGELKLRTQDNETYVTDGGHYIFDASFGHISDASALASGLNSVPGVVEHGLFLGYAKIVLLAGESGVRQLSDN